MPDQQIVRTVLDVRPQTSQAGRSYWVISDETSQEWRCFEAGVAMTAQQLLGQMAVMTVRISPAKDPQFGMNYYLQGIAPAPAGAAPTPPTPLAQPQAMPQQPMPMQPPQMAPQPVQSLPESLRAPVKTLGQGGTFSDADVTRMARTSGIVAAIGAAFAYEDFRDDDDGSVDWQAVYAVAEAASKFILFRKREGWVPGIEIEAPQSNEDQIMAEIHESFPGAEEVALPQMPQMPQMPQASTDQAPGGEVGWGD